MNRKIVIIITSILIAVSIVVLGILAPEISQTIITIKVNGVEIDKKDEIIMGEGENQQAIIRLEGDEREYQLRWTILPTDSDGASTATNQEVSFKSSNPKVIVTKGGLVKFPDEIKESISSVITITTFDGSYTDEITISYRYVKQIVVD